VTFIADLPTPPTPLPLQKRLCLDASSRSIKTQCTIQGYFLWLGMSKICQELKITIIDRYSEKLGDRLTINCFKTD
jgi:hypothetical protein